MVLGQVDALAAGGLGYSRFKRLHSGRLLARLLNTHIWLVRTGSVLGFGVKYTFLRSDGPVRSLHPRGLIAARLLRPEVVGILLSEDNRSDALARHVETGVVRRLHLAQTSHLRLLGHAEFHLHLHLLLGDVGRYSKRKPILAQALGPVNGGVSSGRPSGRGLLRLRGAERSADRRSLDPSLEVGHAGLVLGI